MLNIFKIYMWI